MKKSFTLITVILLFLLNQTFAGNIPTVRQQMENINKCWKEKNVNGEILQQRIPLEGETELIQMHLSLVEQTLRNASTLHLSAEQKRNRLQSLDILHEYLAKEFFQKIFTTQTGLPISSTTSERHALSDN